MKLFHDIHHIKEWQHDGENNGSDDDSEYENDDWFKHRGEVFDDAINFFVISSTYSIEHFSECTSLFSYFYSRSEFYREKFASSESILESEFIFDLCQISIFSFDKIASHSAWERFSGFDFLDDCEDFIFIREVSDTISYDKKCFIDEDSSTKKSREELTKRNKHLLS